MSKGWIGVDLDKTLAYYTGWADGTIGAPILPMLNRVKRWLSAGEEVRIFTARVSGDRPDVPEQRRIIREWCKVHLGKALVVTCEKDHEMRVLYDDRAVQVRPNTGILVGDEEPEPM